MCYLTLVNHTVGRAKRVGRPQKKKGVLLPCVVYYYSMVCQPNEVARTVLEMIQLLVDPRRFNNSPAGWVRTCTFGVLVLVHPRKIVKERFAADRHIVWVYSRLV